VDEQGVPLELEIDEHDRDDPATLHVLVREDGNNEGTGAARAIATGRFYVLSEGRVQIGRMAVLPEVRSRGAGAAILAALETEACRRGFREARLDAQTHATGFYRKFGFSDAGPEHLDAGILHQPMSKTLV